MAIKRVAVVLNGKAGALLDQAGAAGMLETALADAGLDAVFIGQDAGTLPERVQQAAGSGVEAVVVAGGDGTVACAGHALAGGDIPLGILPFGTMNLLAKDLGLPIGDVAAGLRVVAAGSVRAIDVGEVSGHSFLCASMLGLPVQLGRTREETRGSAVQALSRMAPAVLAQLRRARRLGVRMTVDGKAASLRASSLTITVNAIDESCGRAFGRTDLAGGKLGVYVIRHLGIVEAARLLLRMALGRWRHDDALTEQHAATVDIVSRRPLQVMNDGELATIAPPLRYRIRPGALRVLVP